MVVTFLGVAHGQGERRRVRVRGRARPAAGRAIARPAPQQPPINELSCPEPEGLQVYPDPTSCNRFYKVTKYCSVLNNHLDRYITKRKFIR